MTRKGNYKERWTQDERSFVVDNYQDMTNFELAETLGKTEAQVQVFLSLRGCVRDDFAQTRVNRMHRFFRYLDAKYGTPPFNNKDAQF